MRATRAYLAGIGTAGALALGAALVFAAASAIIAFHGWPGANTSTVAARQVLSVTPPPSGVARRLAHIATTAKRPPVSHHHAARVAHAATHRHAVTGTAAHHRIRTHTHSVSTQHGSGTTTPRTTNPGSTHHIQPRVHHRRSGGPVHSKSYPTGTQTTPTTATPPTTTAPTTTAPTVTTAVTTAPTTTTTTTTTHTTTTPTTTTTHTTTTSTPPVKIRVPVGGGHTVTITVPTTTTPVTVPTGPITVPIPSTSTSATTPRLDQGNARPGSAGALGH